MLARGTSPSSVPASVHSCRESGSRSSTLAFLTAIVELALLLDLPKGSVPGLKLHTLAPPCGLNESTVILEFLRPLRALACTSGPHHSHACPRIPSLFAGTQPVHWKEEFSAAPGQLGSLLERGEREISVKGGAGSGLWCEGGELNWTDVMVGPSIS
ncbi:hypothetical protein BJV78DRAFT_209484 [Lactifluus subvellereus]|nr:hypothetical protein BJV78DRAFT_209484 [Lactifluus subvellereus]